MLFGAAVWSFPHPNFVLYVFTEDFKIRFGLGALHGVLSSISRPSDHFYFFSPFLGVTSFHYIPTIVKSRSQSVFFRLLPLPSSLFPHPSLSLCLLLFPCSSYLLDSYVLLFYVFRLPTTRRTTITKRITQEFRYFFFSFSVVSTRYNKRLNTINRTRYINLGWFGWNENDHFSLSLYTFCFVFLAFSCWALATTARLCRTQNKRQHFMLYTKTHTHTQWIAMVVLCAWPRITNSSEFSTDYIVRMLKYVHLCMFICFMTA